MSNKEVARFMVGMSMDAGALKRFHANPDAEMRRFGISEAAAKVIKSKDAPAIHNAIRENFASADADIVNILVVVL
ncbi:MULTISPECIES: hypothetical protein [unclassified Rhizobium]|jgi:hypothetical protein|uniref:hypothetical protein n=1 Tax=unclassified Rhizobium TaxID=2613769 RepID=UPI003D276906